MPKNRTQLIGEFKTMSTNSKNGNQNMKLSMKVVNGTMLNSGETFSFNANVGNSNDLDRGFLPGSAKNISWTCTVYSREKFIIYQTTLVRYLIAIMFFNYSFLQIKFQSL